MGALQGARAAGPGGPRRLRDPAGRLDRAARAASAGDDRFPARPRGRRARRPHRLADAADHRHARRLVRPLRASHGVRRHADNQPRHLSRRAARPDPRADPARLSRRAIANSHGGNNIAIQQIADELATELPATIVATGYAWESSLEFARILEDQGGIQHACEAETSMMLAVEPDLVDTSDLAALATDRGAGFLKAGKGSYRWRPFQHMTANGVSGVPTRATAEKGERLLDAAAQAVAALITDPETWAPWQDRRGENRAGAPAAFRSGGMRDRGRRLCGAAGSPEGERRARPDRPAAALGPGGDDAAERRRPARRAGGCAGGRAARATHRPADRRLAGRHRSRCAGRGRAGERLLDAPPP